MVALRNGDDQCRVAYSSHPVKGFYNTPIKSGFNTAVFNRAGEVHIGGEVILWRKRGAQVLARVDCELSRCPLGIHFAEWRVQECNSCTTEHSPRWQTPAWAIESESGGRMNSLRRNRNACLRRLQVGASGHCIFIVAARPSALRRNGRPGINLPRDQMRLA